jgi:hypothetical protein
MPYPLAKDLAPNAFVIRLETNDLVAPAAFGTMLREVDRLAHLRTGLGSDADLRIVDIGTGTIWAHIVAGLAISANVAAIAAFACYLEERMRRKTGALAESLAALAIDNGVVEAKIVMRDRTITIATNDLPARRTVEQKRQIAAGIAEMERAGGYGRAYGMDYGGKPITLAGQEITLDNDRLTMDGGDQAPEGVKDLAESRERNPISATGGLKFGGSAKLGQLRHFVGRLHPGRTGHSDARIEGRSGTMYHLRFNEGLSRDDLPWGDQVVVAGIRDAEERDVVHTSEIIRVTEH